MSTLQILKKSLKSSLADRINVRQKQPLTEEQLKRLGKLQELGLGLCQKVMELSFFFELGFSVSLKIFPNKIVSK